MCGLKKSKEYRIKNKDKLIQYDLERNEKYLEKIQFYNARDHAKEQCVPFEITPDDIKEVTQQYCPILKIKLIRGKGVCSDNSPSLDRTIPELGYVKGNIAVISHRANTIKSNGTILEHEKILQYMKDHQPIEDYMI